MVYKRLKSYVYDTDDCEIERIASERRDIADYYSSEWASPSSADLNINHERCF